MLLSAKRTRSRALCAKSCAAVLLAVLCATFRLIIAVDANPRARTVRSPRMPRVKISAMPRRECGRFFPRMILLSLIFMKTPQLYCPRSIVTTRVKSCLPV